MMTKKTLSSVSLIRGKDNKQKSRNFSQTSKSDFMRPSIDVYGQTSHNKKNFIHHISIHT